MTNSNITEYDKLLKALKDKVKEFEKSPEKARKFLQELGIITPTGRLTKRYK